jgi:hypothetical protein
MKAINDPIPPNHPASPNPNLAGRNFRFYDIDLSGLAPPKDPPASHKPELGHGHRDFVASASKSSLRRLDEFEELPMRMQLSQGWSIVHRDRTRASTLCCFSFFSSFEHAKNLMIMGPNRANNTKNSSKSVISSYFILNNIVRILLLL